MSTAAITTPSVDFRKADRDKDNDTGTGEDETGDSVLAFGHAASKSERQAVTGVLKRYYAAAAALDGATACSMIYSTLAKAVPEDYGTGSGGPSYMSGATCPTVMISLFKHFHEQIVADKAVLMVKAIRLEGHHGPAVLSFGTMPERQIQVRREGGAWKIDGLIDSPLP